jgi:hypothetical protein
MFSRYEITDDHKSLHELIEQLENRIKVLEEENIETTNVLYEIMNSLNGLDQRIDILHGSVPPDELSTTP